jgi:hypothetical protein
MPRPVYWKPKYATRGMRHRAWVKQQAQREERLKRLPRGPSLSERLRAWLRRRWGSPS